MRYDDLDLAAHGLPADPHEVTAELGARNGPLTVARIGTLGKGETAERNGDQENRENPEQGFTTWHRA
jgi:hypothetical protein